jgi:hypothetical protein
MAEPFFEICHMLLRFFFDPTSLIRKSIPLTVQRLRFQINEFYFLGSALAWACKIDLSRLAPFLIETHSDDCSCSKFIIGFVFRSWLSELNCWESWMFVWVVASRDTSLFACKLKQFEAVWNNIWLDHLISELWLMGVGWLQCFLYTYAVCLNTAGI